MVGKNRFLIWCVNENGMLLDSLRINFYLFTDTHKYYVTYKCPAYYLKVPYVGRTVRSYADISTTQRFKYIICEQRTDSFDNEKPI